MNEVLEFQVKAGERISPCRFSLCLSVVSMPLPLTIICFTPGEVSLLPVCPTLFQQETDFYSLACPLEAVCTSPFLLLIPREFLVLVVAVDWIFQRWPCQDPSCHPLFLYCDFVNTPSKGRICLLPLEPGWVFGSISRAQRQWCHVTAGLSCAGALVPVSQRSCTSFPSSTPSGVMSVA